MDSSRGIPCIWGVVGTSPFFHGMVRSSREGLPKTDDTLLGGRNIPSASAGDTSGGNDGLDRAPLAPFLAHAPLGVEASGALAFGTFL